MGFLDKLDKFIPGAKQRKAEDDKWKADMDKKDAFADKIYKSDIYQDYMEDDIRHAVEFDSEQDLLVSLFYSAVTNEDIPAIKNLASMIDNDFDLKNAVEDIDNKEIYDLVVSLNKDSEFWKKNTNMKRDDEFKEHNSSLISGALRYLNEVEEVPTKNDKEFKLVVAGEEFFPTSRQEMTDNIHDVMERKGSVSVNVYVRDENNEWKWIHQAEYDDHLGPRLKNKEL